ncbi:MAG: endonuclease/exonuclease/phosphatase family protein [Planctomycetota bacterium]|nr:endonuclease/exonuclease/phosphatase family protein [Planctomycetota bacterium]
MREISLRNRVSSPGGWMGVFGCLALAALISSCSGLPEPGGPRIHEIQGRSHRSPYHGRDVAGVVGIVTFTGKDHFFLQDPVPDQDDSTSEALRVYVGKKVAVPARGDRVMVFGRVTEYYPGGKKTGNLPMTGIEATAVDLIASDRPLPAFVTIAAGGRLPPGKIIDNDSVGGEPENPATPFDPAQDGIDFYESLEGMLVEIDEAIVVGPSNKYSEAWIIPGRAGDFGLRTPRGGLLLREDDRNPERMKVRVGKSPGWNVGDALKDVRGVLDYSYGNFVLRLLGTPVHEDRGLEPEVTSLRGNETHLSVASYNVLNFSAVAVDRAGLIAAQLVGNLGSPDLVALQEMQDNNGPLADGGADASESFKVLVSAVAAAGGPSYDFLQINPGSGKDGGQPGGNIRVGFLFNPARLKIVRYREEKDGLPPSPSRIGVGSPAFQSSRKSLFCEFLFGSSRIFVINNHLSSKFGSPPMYGSRQPPANGGFDRRVAQFGEISAVADRIATAVPGAAILVLGDFNEFPFEEPMKSAGAGKARLKKLSELLPLPERYTYNFQGNSQTLDHVLVSERLAAGAEYDVVHVNSEFAVQTSDHDPVVARLKLPR